MGEFDAFILAAGDGVHESLPCTRVAPVDRRVLVGRDGHVEVETKSNEHDEKGGADNLSVRQCEGGDNWNEQGIDRPNPEASFFGAGIPHEVSMFL